MRRASGDAGSGNLHLLRRSEASSTDDNGGMEPEETSLSIDPVSTMDEIDIELPDSSESPFGDEKFDDEDDEDKEDEEEE